jgi:hypothetical protein
LSTISGTGHSEESGAQSLAFFAHRDVRAALDKLSAELRERRMMSGEEVHALVDAEALQAAKAALDPT